MLIDSCNCESILVLIFVEIRCDTVVLSHRALQSSPGWLHCLSLTFNRPSNIARGWSMREIAVVSTALGLKIVR
jgi:hypothetical protein